MCNGQFFEVVSLTIGFTCLITAIAWIFYGGFCIADCGMEKAQCNLTNMRAIVQVCQNEWGRWLPYSAQATFRFPIQISVHEIKDFYITLFAGCGSTENEALSVGYQRYPQGYSHECYYAIPPDFHIDRPMAYFSWTVAISGKGMALWLKANILYTYIAAGIVILFTILAIVRACIISYFHRKFRYEALSSAAQIPSSIN